jgi:thiol-disulfide isomerase/thioredoxin
MTHNRQLKTAVGSLALALGAALFASAPLRSQDLGLKLGTKAPTFALKTVDGSKTIDLAQFIGKKPVFLEFWASWCENCKALEPALRAAMQQYAGKVEFIGVAVSVNQPARLAAAYAKKHGLPGTQLYDQSGDASEAYETPATSYVVVIGKDGTVKYTGLGGKQDLVAAVKKAF